MKTLTSRQELPSSSGVSNRLLVLVLAVLTVFALCHQVTAQETGDGNGGGGGGGSNDDTTTESTNTDTANATTCQDDTCGHGTCNDTSGSVVCTCDSGWTGDNCTADVDECGQNVCQNNAYCENRAGSYTCLCPQGWSGTNCDEDVDECAADDSLCPDEKASCKNTNGSYVCQCEEGYERLLPDSDCTEIVLLPYDNAKSQRLAGDDEIFGPFLIPYGFSLGQGGIAILYYISSNGYITFNTRFSEPTMPSIDSAKLTPLSFLAPYWADIDIPQGNGTSGLYHVALSLADTYSDNVTKALFEEYTESAGLGEFRPVFIGVVTWVDVLPYKAEDFPGFQAATFQLVLASNGWILKGRVGWRSTWSDLEDFNVQAYQHLAASTKAEWSPLTGIPKKADFATTGSSTSVAPCVEWLGTQGTQFEDGGSSRFPCPCSLSQATSDPLFSVIGDSKCAESQVFDMDGSKRKCCYSSEGKMMIDTSNTNVIPVLKDEGRNNQTIDGQSTCCGGQAIHPVACGQFRQKFPVDDCSRYAAPDTGLVWGYGHIITLDNVEYTFNGWGEYYLLKRSAQNSDGVQVEIQGRSQEKDQANYNTTVFTALAVKYGNETVFEVHAVSGQLKVYSAGQEVTTTLDSVGQAAGVVPSLSEGTTLNVFFPVGLTLKVTVLSGDLLSMSVTAREMGPMENWEGLLVASSMDPAFAGLSSQDKFTKAGAWSLSENTTLFVYNLTGEGDNFTVYQHPEFVPTFLSSVVDELLSQLNETGKMAEASSACAENVACLQDFLVTGAEQSATKTTQDTFEGMRNMLVKKPPRFITTATMLNVTLADGVYTQEIAVEPEATNSSVYPNVTLTEKPDTLNVTLKASPGQPGNWTFTWYLDEAVKTLTSVTLDFKAESSVTDMTSVYSPAVALCACAQKSECDLYTATLQQPSALTPGVLYKADCVCDDTKGGRFCESNVSACDVCYNVSLCNVSATGNVTCECPEGYMGEDGKKCYEKDECLQEDTCEQQCANSPGSYTCSCDPGYTLVTGGRCQDDNECQAVTHNCSARQFCENTVGGFVCPCRPNFGGANCGEDVERRYGGILQFLALPDRGQGWSDQLLNPQSQEFNNLATEIVNLLKYLLTEKNITFLEIQVVDFKYIQAARRRRSTDAPPSTIEARYEVSTAQEEEVTSLQAAIDSGYESSCTGDQCRLKGSDDNSVVLYGVVKSQSGFQADYDLCSSDRTNDCHDTSTLCQSVNGTAQCQCRPGYQRWNLNPHICLDKDECQENTTEVLCGIMSTTVTNDTQCHNTDGTYYCTCPHSYMWDAGQMKCVEVTLKDACSLKTPCGNDAECVNTMDEAGYACRCKDGWTGMDCKDADGEAERYKWTLIGVAIGLGILCFIFLVIIIVICMMRTNPRKACLNTGTIGGLDQM